MNSNTQVLTAISVLGCVGKLNDLWWLPKRACSPGIGRAKILGIYKGGKEDWELQICDKNYYYDTT